MDLGLTGKVAWVTGASTGLGRATAACLAREGALVAISARREDALASTAKDIESEGGARCIPLPLDVTDRDAIGRVAERVVDALGPIDILVSNAGGPPPGDFETMGDDDLQRAFELTGASAWRLTQAVLPSMKERGGCLVYLTSSTTKELVPGLLLSNTIRPSVVGMAKTLSKELGPRGIRVVCVAPGRIDTERVRSLDEDAARRGGTSASEVRGAKEAQIPLRRYGKPEELGDVVAFLASGRASYVSGITVLVDGGASHGILS